MDEREIKLRCIEAAAKNNPVHKDGVAAGVLEQAEKWFTWIIGAGKGTLGLPKK